MPESIIFHSTNDLCREREGVDFSAALMRGLAPDKGLYMMQRSHLPQISPEEFEEFRALPYSEIAVRVLTPFVEGKVPQDTLRSIAEEAYNYDVPVEKYADDAWVLRLDRGPTASFKDFAARMMARIMRYFLKREGRQMVILTATSGDTGGAVASAFHNVDGIRVVVLFPGAEVSERQRRQMTTLGGNVHAIDIDGKFDDCQALVKRAFVDSDLESLHLSSANSINVGRLLPQSVYYIYALSRIETERPIAVCVPSGNFGNLVGGLLAFHRGLTISRFVAAVNENDEFPIYLRTRDYDPVVPSRNCLSSAMNVGHPSNLARLVALYGGTMDEIGNIYSQPDFEAIHRDIVSREVSDAETRQAIRDAYDRHGIILEPHGAVGYRALEALEMFDDYATVLLETAHPAKFPEVVIETIGVDPELPESMKRQATLPEEKIDCPDDYEEFKAVLKKILQ